MRLQTTSRILGTGLQNSWRAFIKKSSAVKKKDHGCSLVMAYRFSLFDANILDLTEKKEKQIPEW